MSLSCWGTEPSEARGRLPFRADAVVAAARSSSGRAVSNYGVISQRVAHGCLPAGALLWLDPLCHWPHSLHLQEESAGAPFPFHARWPLCLQRQQLLELCCCATVELQMVCYVVGLLRHAALTHPGHVEALRHSNDPSGEKTRHAWQEAYQNRSTQHCP